LGETRRGNPNQLWLERRSDGHAVLQVTCANNPDNFAFRLHAKPIKAGLKPGCWTKRSEAYAYNGDLRVLPKKLRIAFLTLAKDRES
jgi:hypothetical protein